MVMYDPRLARTLVRFANWRLRQHTLHVVREHHRQTAAAEATLRVALVRHRARRAEEREAVALSRLHVADLRDGLPCQHHGAGRLPGHGVQVVERLCVAAELVRGTRRCLRQRRYECRSAEAAGRVALACQWAVRRIGAKAAVARVVTRRR